MDANINLLSVIRIIFVQPTPFSGKICFILLLANIGRVEEAGEFDYPFLAVNFNVSLEAVTVARTAEAVNFVKSCVVGVVIQDVVYFPAYPVELDRLCITQFALIGLKVSPPSP